MPVSPRRIVWFACSILSSVAWATPQEPSLDIENVGEVGVSAGAAQRRISVSLETAMPKPGERPFVANQPLALELTSTPAVALKSLPPIRSKEPRYGMLRIGRGGRQVFVLDCSDPTTKRYDLIWLDRDRDLAFDGPDEATPITGRVVRDPSFDLDYVEFTAIPIDVYYGVRVDEAGNERSDIEPRAFTFYAWHPRSGPIERLFCVAASWREGVAKIDGKDARVVLYDESASGLFATERDRWSILELAPTDALPAGIELVPMRIAMRFGGRPYRIIAMDPEGRVVEIGEESEASLLQSQLDNDPLMSEPPRPRTDEPVAWLSDFASAEAKAKEDGKPICVLYTAEWSRHARLLEERTLLDSEVARLLREKFVCVRLNPAQERVLSERHSARIVPTMVFVDRNGNVLERSVGYRPARMLADDLRRWRN